MTLRISFDEISVSLDCSITGLWHQVNKNYVFKVEVYLKILLSSIDFSGP